MGKLPGDLPPPAGHWLFKEQGAVMGPVDGAALVDRLFNGSLDPETEVADETVGRWSRLEDVPAFRVHVAKARARRRVEAEKARALASRRRRRVVTLVSTLVVAGAAGAGTFYGVWTYTLGQFKDPAVGVLAEPVIQMSATLVELTPPAAEEGEGGPARVAVDASLGAIGAELPPERDEDEKAVAAVSGQRTGSRRGPGTRGKTTGTGKTGGKAGGKTGGQASGDGGAKAGEGTMAAAYDMTHINKVVAQESRSLFPCIKAEVKRTGFKGEIKFEFVVKNNGRVGRLWIDTRTLRNTPMEACFKEKLATWKFNTFPGPQPTVKQSFTIR